MSFFNFGIASLMTMLPFLILKYKGIADKDQLLSFLLSFFWMIISFIFSPILINSLKYDLNWFVVVPTIVIESIYNYFILRGALNIKKFPKSFFVIVLFFLLVLFQLIPVYLFHIDLNNISTTNAMYLTLFGDGCGLIILILLYWKELKADFKKLVKDFNPIMDKAIRYWFVGLMIMIVSNLLINWFIPQAVATNENSVQAMIDQTPLLTFICAAILAPVIEELTFRKAFRDVFKTKWLFILTSGLVFGGLHVVPTLTSFWDLFLIIPYSALGCSFAYMLEDTNNVYTSIIMHFIHNAILTSASIFVGMVIFL